MASPNAQSDSANSEHVPMSYPVLPVLNVVVFPGISISLTVGRQKSLAALKKADEHDRHLVIITQKEAREGKDPLPDELYRTGVLCRIQRVRNVRNGQQVVLQGISRFRVSEFIDTAECLEVRGEEAPDIIDADSRTVASLVESIKLLSRELMRLLNLNSRQIDEVLDGVDNASRLIDLCGEYIDVPIAKKQELLEQDAFKQRALMLLECMQMQKEAILVQREVNKRVNSKMGSRQREVYLREQLSAIREELGEGGPSDHDAEYAKKIAEAGMPKDVEKIAYEEERRLSNLGNSSPESHVIRNYLDLLCAMPWKNAEETEIDLKQARAILDSDHYGLDKIKKRIVEHLAVLKLKKEKKGSILLFVGPPGVGKTSLGQSIAKVLGRKFARISLGGVRDDAEIRGHRRTYIGAMPGRIIQGIKRAQVNNPVFVLDEIDKMSHSYHGDPAGALLEVLDPEQNGAFLDHYLDVPFDLSRVFFVCTANSMDGIPSPLLDRMEVIDVSGYTTEEKLNIALQHLVPKQCEEHGIGVDQISLPDETLRRLIGSYTREAGVRELQRKIASVLRARAEDILAPDAVFPIIVKPADLDVILGTERYHHDSADAALPPGVATGLAWTPTGGDILFIESCLMPGSGKLMLTGQLGEVMKESAHIALSLLRANLPALVPDFAYDKQDIHVHVPAGAIPKDGPSAGIALLSAMASLLSGLPISPKLAMTGEITLRGAVTPVGGIKEKILAAHRAGITTLLLSRRNEKDLREVPESVLSQLQIIFVDTANDVLREALGLTTSFVPRALPTSTHSHGAVQ